MMFLLMLTAHLLVFSTTALDANARLPSLWNEAPSTIADYPLLNDPSTSQTGEGADTRLINPWLYTHRLGLYKILISTTSPLMPFSSSSNESNILFGLASQFGWQFDSNRLFSNGTREVSTRSWWASANYYLSVIPFLAAVDAGIIRQGSFQIVRRESFCVSADECFRQVPETMAKWRLFFTNLLQSNYCPSQNVDDEVIDRCYLGPMWAAHVASIEHALPLIASKASLLPSSNEQRFGLGWASLVGFIAMTRKNTNLLETDKYQDEFLPKRMLRDGDEPPNIRDLPSTVNGALQLFFTIRSEWYSKLEPLWEAATCNYEARQDAQRLMEKVAVSKLTAALFYAEAVIHSLFSSCDQ